MVSPTHLLRERCRQGYRGEKTKKLPPKKYRNKDVSEKNVKNKNEMAPKKARKKYPRPNSAEGEKASARKTFVKAEKGTEEGRENA